MRKSFLIFVMTSLLLSHCITASAQQPDSPVDSQLPPNISAITINENASAEDVIRRNPDFMKFNDNGVLIMNGKEVHQIVVNDRVIYNDDDTITDPARLLSEITLRSGAAATSAKSVATLKYKSTAASAKTVADSVAQITLPVSLPEGETIESFLLKHDVYKDEEGNYFSQFFGEKKKMITKDVTFWLMYWAVKDSVSKSQQQASSQEVDIKHIVDTVYVPDSLLYIEKSVVLPVKQAEQIALLRKLPYLWVSDEGDVYVFGSKISGINFNGIDGIEFVRSPEYSIVYLPFPPIGPLDPNIKAVTARMDGKGSRPLTPEEMREYGLIGIPIPLPEGETVESYLLKQPGVHKDDAGNIIYPNGRKQTPEDIKQIELFTHISIKDSLLKYQQQHK